jgi:hypothetical protein
MLTIPLGLVGVADVVVDLAANAVELVTGGMTPASSAARSEKKLNKLDGSRPR